LLRKVIAVEQIYDAAFDDEALRGLAVDLAATLDARSALIHWIHEDGSADVLAHSGYFSDEQLALYGREFAAIDPWVGATAAPERANRVIDLESLVPVTVFAASDFYNEYVRSMGDDTGRCIGVRLQNGHGSGFIALQRGISQPGFEPTTVARLQHYSGHLMRMLAMRGRLITAERNSSELDAMVAALGQPAILVDAAVRVKQANRAAEWLLRSDRCLEQRSGMLRVHDRNAERALQTAVLSAVNDANSGVGAVALSGSAGRRLDLSITGVGGATGIRLALILISDPLASDDTRVRRLRELYGLSAGEACLAVMLAEGLTPSDIAEQRRVAIGTVRVQIKQIAFKLGCHRQSEIVRVVSSLPLLRPERPRPAD
jgi:DNA-binding CsgD family transcriptional regulator